eukprot:CAMPEP_0115888144 /NCGR_PEP_ID=MMETSP0287-20121206/32154_1 /TAXON_ID=412157 /ORGANISM="Chrysochromulina rotalis, Strain UIO044" /LENGTH=132 /DNA_ID=CAMNT_0003344815 /DNA_START=200 /DNA_END=596 /DNA_ORIENTATION=+
MGRGTWDVADPDLMSSVLCHVHCCMPSLPTQSAARLAFSRTPSRNPPISQQSARSLRMENAVRQQHEAARGSTRQHEAARGSTRQHVVRSRSLARGGRRGRVRASHWSMSKGSQSFSEEHAHQEEASQRSMP